MNEAHILIFRDLETSNYSLVRSPTDCRIDLLHLRYVGVDGSHGSVTSHMLNYRWLGYIAALI